MQSKKKEVIPINNTRKNIARAKAIEAENRKRLLKLNPDLNDKSGIYFLTRTEMIGIDESCDKFCRECGQAIDENLEGMEDEG